jgi:hypothetical protein
MPDDVGMALGFDGSVDGGADGQQTEVEDRGSFSHGVCRVCGWLGPGRRARRTSHRDAADHAESCPGEPEPTGP